MKNYYIKFLAIPIITLFGFSLVTAHGGLDSKTPTELAKLQREMVKDGFLDANKIKYGVFDSASELAFDKWDQERLRKKIRAEMEMLKKERETEEAQRIEDQRIEAERYAKLSTLEKVLENVQKYFKNIFN